MLKVLQTIFNVAVTSLYLFPFEFSSLPGVNTKMMLAALGLLILFFKTVNKRALVIDRIFWHVSFLACLVSLTGLCSVVYNGTSDYSYASYIVSAWVWLGGAYAICSLLDFTHGRVTFPLLCAYLTAVCITQCALAIAIDLNRPFKLLVDMYVQQGQDFLNSYKVERLYGIGASLDVAGSRFAAVLVMISCMLCDRSHEKRWYHYLLYILSFVVLTVAGDMIARTTLIGTVIGIVYMTVASWDGIVRLSDSYLRLLKWFAVVLLFSVPVVTYFYNTVPQVEKNIRFGFEGFFSLAEKGRWEVSSNEKLMKTMIVYPDKTRTWIIGDGYFENPDKVDPHYVGPVYKGFYKDTDVGYLRFIFYFGLAGLAVFSFFIVRTGLYCMARLPEWKLMITFLLALNFIVWFKVSTDIFLVFALLFCMPAEKAGDGLKEN